MNKIIALGKQLAIGLVIYAITVLTLLSVPAVKGMQLSMHGWGWAVLFAAMVVLQFVQGYLEGFFNGLLKGTKLELPPGAGAFLNVVVDYIRIALAVFATAAIVPALASYNSAATLMAVTIIIGVASATYSLILGRVSAKD